MTQMHRVWLAYMDATNTRCTFTGFFFKKSQNDCKSHSGIFLNQKNRCMAFSRHRLIECVGSASIILYFLFQLMWSTLGIDPSDKYRFRCMHGCSIHRHKLSTLDCLITYLHMRSTSAHTRSRAVEGLISGLYSGKTGSVSPDRVLSDRQCHYSWSTSCTVYIYLAHYCGVLLILKYVENYS